MTYEEVPCTTQEFSTCYISTATSHLLDTIAGRRPASWKLTSAPTVGGHCGHALFLGGPPYGYKCRALMGFTGQHGVQVFREIGKVR